MGNRRADDVTSLERTDGTYKVKETNFVEETQISSQTDNFTNSGTKEIFVPEAQVTSRINKETHTSEVDSLQDFQKTILSEMKNMRSFLEKVEKDLIKLTTL